MKHNTAALVRYNLEQYFSAESAGDPRRSSYSSSDSKIAATGLSQRKPLRFIEDSQTNSILVQGATPEQLQMVKDLIDIYDSPEQPNAKASRMVKIFMIKHSKASLIADTIKDVYRDLLSSNDKALDGGNQSASSGRGGPRYFDGGEDQTRINQSRFKGQLSIGVDETSNRLLVSCPESLMKNVEAIVEELDRAAAPIEQTFQVMRIDRSIDADSLQKRLAEMLKSPSSRIESPQSANTPKEGESSQQQPGQRPRGGGYGGGNRGGRGGQRGGGSDGFGGGGNGGGSGGGSEGGGRPQ